MFGGGRHYGGQVGYSGRTETLVFHEVTKIAAVLKPFALWPVVVAFALATRLVWPGYWLVFCTYIVAGAIGAAFSLHYSRHADLVSRYHGAVTVALVTAIMCWVTLAGFNPATGFLLFVVMPLVCLSWALRAYLEEKRRQDASAISGIFETAGLGPARLQLRPLEGAKAKLTGKVQLPPGQTAPADLIKKATYVEGGLKLPPGAVTVVPNEDRADWADVTISDPRVLKDPQPWPGPSALGASIARPVRVGFWQDGEPGAFVITGTHLEVMGMTGSGKSLGACWSTIAELITRPDAAVLAADITKGGQTFGPLLPALHRFETTREGAKQLLLDVESIRRARTDYLTELGLQKWQEGCGLSYLVVWLEECPDIVDALSSAEQERFFASLKSARSAGISFVFSLQRSDWSQLPTIARGQLAKWCFGVADITDAAFGLSRIQKQRGCHPEEWGARHPGKSFLDAPSVPENRVAMPLRTWYWGEDDSIIRAHAEAYPAEGRPADAITARALGAKALEAPAPEVTLPPEAPPVTRKNQLQKHMLDRGLARYTISDLLPFAESVGRSRNWLHAVLNELAAAGFCTEIPGEGPRAAKSWELAGREAVHLAKAKKFHANSKRRAQEYGSPVDADLTPEQIAPLFEAETCAYCQDRIDGDRTIDHMTPLSRGGAHAFDNLAACCRYCNDSKGARTVAEFLQGAAR